MGYVREEYMKIYLLFSFFFSLHVQNVTYLKIGNDKQGKWFFIYSIFLQLTFPPTYVIRTVWTKLGTRWMWTALFLPMVWVS